MALLASPIEDILIALLLLLLIARSLGLLVKNLKVSPMVGELIGGILLSPLLLGLLEESPSIIFLSDFAIIVIMFHSGMHTDFNSFKRNKWNAILIGAMGVIVTFLLIFVLSYIVFDLPLEVSLFLGAILSNSAIEVSSALLSSTKFRKLRTIVVGASFVDDILAVFVLGVVLSFVHETPRVLLPLFGEVTGLSADIIHLAITSAKVIAFLLFTFLLVDKLSRRILDRFLPKGFNVVLSIGLIFAFSLGILAKWVGLNQVIGVYLAGLVLSKWGLLPDPMMKRGVAFMKYKAFFNRMMEAIFSPIFFGVVGIMLGTALVEEGGDSLLFIAAGVGAFLFFAVMGKMVGCGLGARMKGIAPAGALLIGISMWGRGALELILVRSGMREGVVSPDLFSIVVLVTIGSILLTPFAYRFVNRRREKELERSEL